MTTNKIARSESSPTKCKAHELEDFLSEKKSNLRKVKYTELHHKESAISRKRKKILNEIFETEKTYQHHLMLLISLFVEPIKVSVVLPAKIIDGIFSNIEALQKVSSHLLELMENDGVVHALLQLAPYMKLYSLYANNFNNANKMLEDWMKKSTDFSRLIRFQECREEMQSLKLSSLLVTPIQRVPRYRLLLENLIDKTFEDDPDFIKLKEAFGIIVNVATHINECVRQHENFHKMLAIQNSFTGTSPPKLLAPGRFFIREGPVTKINGRGSAKEIMLFLFNDILICAKKETLCTYECCEIYPLTNCIIEQVMGNAEGNGLFKILCDGRSLLVCAKGEPKPWVTDIKTTISQLHSNLASFRRGEALNADLLPPIKDVPIFKKQSAAFKLFSRSSTTSHESSNNEKKLIVRTNLPDVTMASFKHRKDLVPKRLGSLVNVNRQSMALLDANRNSTIFELDHPRMSTSSDTFHHMSATLQKGDTMCTATSHIEDEVFRDNRTIQNHNWTVTEKKKATEKTTEKQGRTPLSYHITKATGCGSRKSRIERRKSSSPYNVKDKVSRYSDKTTGISNPDVLPDTDNRLPVVSSELLSNVETSSLSSCTIM